MKYKIKVHFFDNGKWQDRYEEVDVYPLLTFNGLFNFVDKEGYNNYCGDSERDYEIVSKHLKALEIIKNKGVNVGLLSRCATVERYNKGICYEPRHLSQEEFDLLKEVLK